MTTWLLPILTALLGYGVHLAQAALARRHKRKDADEERIAALLIKLVEIGDLAGDDSDRGGSDLAAKLWATDVGLLRNKKLRRRLSEDLYMIQSLRLMTGGDHKPGEIRTTWASDAIRCCQAVLRGDRLPHSMGWRSANSTTLGPPPPPAPMSTL